MGIFASKRTSNKANIVLVHGFWADGSGTRSRSHT